MLTLIFHQDPRQETLTTLQVKALPASMRRAMTRLSFIGTQPMRVVPI